MNRGGIEDLPLLRTLLAVRQESRELSYCEVRDSFVLVAYPSLETSRIFLQQLLACLNFTLDSEDLFCWCKQKNDFYELWQHHKLLKTTEITYDEGYRHQFQSETSRKVH